MTETIWHKNGKTIKDGNKYTYKSFLGQYNTEVSKGVYAPYILDAKAKTLKTGESKVIFTDAGIDFYFQEKLLLNVKFNLQTMDTVWTKDTVTISDFKTSTSDEYCTMSYLLTTPNQKSIITVKGGCSGFVDFEFEKTALKDGEQQIVLETDHTGVATDLMATFAKEKNKASYKRGVQVSDSVLLWKSHEVDYHEVFNKEDELKTSIAIKKGVYKVNDVVKVSPTTWGETGIAHTNDDGDYDSTDGFDADGYDSDGNGVGYFGTNGSHDSYFRFRNVTIVGSPTSVDTGTQIEYDCPYNSGAAGGFDFNVYGLEGNIASDFVTTDPTTYTLTTATIAVPSPANSSVDNLVNGASFQAVVKEILDTSWSSGNNMGFMFEDNGQTSSSDQFQVEDYDTAGSGTAAARLTIEYTAGSSSSILPIIMNLRQQMQ